jgi:Tfp pilus assembly protein PilF
LSILSLASLHIHSNLKDTIEADTAIYLRSVLYLWGHQTPTSTLLINMFVKTIISILTIIVLTTTSSYSQISSKGLSLISSPENISQSIQAIIVGVSSYKSPMIPQLEFADADANAFYYFLNKLKGIPAEKIKTFTNEKALASDIDHELRMTLVADPKPGDLVIIYFSGHGDVSREIPDGFLLQYDAQADGDYFTGQGVIRIQVLKKLVELAAISNVKVLLITDACRSGKIIDASGAKNTTAALVQEWDNILKLVSCGPGQLSYEGMEWPNGHGAFTYYLLRGMMGLCDTDGDSKIRFGELAKYVTDNLWLDKKGLQIPKSSGDDFAVLFDVDTRLKRLAEAQSAPEIITLEKNRSITLEHLNTQEDEILIKQYELALKRRLLIRMDQNDKIIIPMELDSIIQVNYRKGDITRFCISPNGNLLAAGTSSKSVLLVDVETRKLVSVINLHKGRVNDVSFSHDGKYLATCSQDKSIKILNFSLPDSTVTIYTNSYPVRVLWSKSDNKVIAILENGKIEYYGINGHLISSIQALKGKLYDVSQDLDGNLILASNDCTLSVWSSEKSKKIKVLNFKTGCITQLAFSKKSNVLWGIDDKGNIIEFGSFPYNKFEVVKISNNSKSSAFTISNVDDYLLRSSSAIGIEAINLNSYITKFLKATKGKNIKQMQYDPKGTQLIYTEIGGNISFNYLNGAIDYAADLLQKIEKTPSLSNKLTRAKGSLLMTLQSEAQLVMNDLLTGSDIKPDLNDVELAVKYLKYAQKIFPNDTLTNNLLECKKLFLEASLINLKNSTNQYNEAIDKLKHILEVEPNASYPYVLLSIIEAKQNNKLNAVTNANLAAGAVPRWSEPLRLLASSLIQQGKYDSAEFVLNQIISIHSESPKGYLLMGKEKQSIGSLSEASQFYQNAISKNENDDAEVLTCYASLQMQRGKFEDATALLSGSLYADTNYYLTHLLLGDLTQKKHNDINKDSVFQQTIRHYEHSLQKAPYESSVYLSLGNFYLKEKRDEWNVSNIVLSDDSVKKYFECAQSLNRYQPDVYAGLGWWEYLYAKDKITALEKFKEAILIDSNSAAAFYNLGNFYAETNDTIKAVATLQIALKKDLKYQNAYLKLMSLYSVKHKQKKLYETYESASKEMPQNPVFPYTLAQYEYNNENYKKAKELLDKTIALDKNYHYAIVSYKEMISTGKISEEDYKLIPLEVVNYNYDHIDTLPNNNLLVCSKGTYYLATPQLKVIKMLTFYDQIKVLGAGSFMIGRAGKWGWMDQLGIEVVPPKFDEIEEGNSVIYVKKNDKWGLYSAISSEFIFIPCNYKTQAEAYISYKLKTGENKSTNDNLPIEKVIYKVN